MTYTQEITLDLNANSAPPIVYAKQSDTESRQILVHFTQDDAEYLVNKNNSVALRVRKPDGKQIMDYAVINDDGTVTVTLTQQCLAAAGRAYADLAEFNSEGKILSTVPFILNIVASPDVMGSEAISSNEFGYLASFIEQGANVVGEAQAWANGYNNDIPVPSSNPAYQNNAKYYAEQAADIANNMGIAAGIPVAPGEQPIITKDGSTYILRSPSVKPNATATATTGEEASVSVVVNNVPNNILEKSFDFSFVLPKGEKGEDAGIANANAEINILPFGEEATVDVDVLDSMDTAKVFKFTFNIPMPEKGDKGNTGNTGATGSQGPQGAPGRSITTVSVPSDNSLQFTFNDGTTQTVTGYTISSASGLNFSADDNGDLTISFNGTQGG